MGRCGQPASRYQHSQEACPPGKRLRPQHRPPLEFQRTRRDQCEFRRRTPDNLPGCSAPPSDLRKERRAWRAWGLARRAAHAVGRGCLQCTHTKICMRLPLLLGAGGAPHVAGGWGWGCSRECGSAPQGLRRSGSKSGLPDPCGAAPSQARGGFQAHRARQTGGEQRGEAENGSGRLALSGGRFGGASEPHLARALHLRRHLRSLLVVTRTLPGPPPGCAAPCGVREGAARCRCPSPLARCPRTLANGALQSD